MKVIALPEVREYFSELIHILYKKEYFGFEENAQKYVEELFLDILFFNVYRKNDEMIFVIRHISNNHVTAQYL